jgi:heterogeneous nuclear ribonucleoprotein L
MMAFYAESGGHAAKRPRVDYHQGGVAAQAAGGGGGGGATIPAVMSPQYIEQQLNKKSNEPEKPNHILLFTVFNPNYPITCEVLHTICSPVGKVLRIVIFRKNGVQAMVEFETLESAKAAKENLFGCDIYSGCCTLKIEYAKPAKLNVYKNDSDSFDYTNPNPGKTANQDQNMQTQMTGPQRPVLLKEPLVARGQVNGNGISHGYENGLAQMTPTLGSTGAVDVTAGHHSIGRTQATQPGGNNYFRGNTGGVGTPILATPISLITSGGQSVGTAPTYHNQGSVCMVYGLNPDKMNANRLFNLFCLYGNVTRVKFLKTKEGCAMVQLGDSAAVERAISNLNNTIFFGTKMQLGFSKQAFLADVQSPYQLPDATPSFQDFMGNKNNRFMNPEMASKNRIQPPSKILHFFNTPPGLDEHEVEKLFMDHGAPQPKCVKMFPSKTDRSSSGLIEFVSQSDALEGLVCCNHLPVNNPSGKFPYIMKLCFSSSRNIPATMRQQ